MTDLTGQKALFEFGSYRLDAAERRLLRDGQPVPLPPKVFDTLVVLVEHSGQLVLKEELMARLWPDTFVEEVTLARYISDLRKALNNGPERKYIETVSKRGYRFSAEVRKLAGAELIIQRRTKSTIVVEEEIDSTTTKSIAVLPFKPINPAGRDEYLELGIADALITRLSDISQMVVRPTSSVRRYSDLDLDSSAAGRELAVDSVLEGCIQKMGNRIRVTARLVRVDDGCSLWSGKFDQNFTDMFTVEDSISQKVAAALELKLTGEERTRLRRRYTRNTAAYHLYLKGRYHWNKRTEESLNKSIEFFNQAIDIDPTYALAYAGLSDCYTKLGDAGVTAITPREAFALGRATALRALEIDESLAEVHASLGHLDMHLLQWADAERAFKRAIELNPNYATAHHWYSYFMMFHGRFEKAMEEIATAIRLDPLSLPIADSVGEFLYFARRYDESIEQFRKTLEMDPNFLASRLNLGRAYVAAGKFDLAEGEFLKARQITNESIDALAGLSYTYGASGNRPAALKLAAQLTELSKQRYVSSYDMALIHVALGETEDAFRSLEKGYQECAEWMIYTNVDPRLDPLRDDARFADLLARLGFGEGVT
ncbi:MAG TPA: tetratricopeptide repeat protein [Blastocatellia bacterium]|nr:tetratricopeptide repeat protein [Blastocatellia bacterium]